MFVLITHKSTENVDETKNSNNGKSSTHQQKLPVDGDSADFRRSLIREGADR